MIRIKNTRKFIIKKELNKWIEIILISKASQSFCHTGKSCLNKAVSQFTFKQELIWQQNSTYRTFKCSLHGTCVKQG